MLPEGSTKVVITPAGVIRPIRSFSRLVNHTLPSGPAVMLNGESIAPAVPAKVVIVPDGVMRPIRWLSRLVNQRLPSAPAVIPPGRSVEAVPPGSANIVIDPDGVIRPIRSPDWLVNHTLPSGPPVIPEGRSTAGIAERRDVAHRGVGRRNRHGAEGADDDPRGGQEPRSDPHVRPLCTPCRTPPPARR